MKNFMVIIKKQDCALADHCEDRQPPPPSPSVDTSLSPLLILMFCGLAVSFTFICYLTLSRRCRRERNPETTDEVPHEVFFDRDFGPVTHHPMWLINSVGLNQSEIESIDVFKYKKDEKLIQGTDCSVCLSEFQDDESLRLLPKCSHAFHVPCIDTWLRSHTNCPLCRAPIFKNSNVQITDTTTDSNLIEESEDSDQSIELVEAENDREVAKTSSGMRVCSDLADRLGVKGQESVVAMRRSVSMNESSVANIHRPFQGRRSSDRFGPLTKYESMAKGGHKRKGSGSSSSISIRIRAMKRSSFGHSSRKASGFTKDVARLGSYNRSY